MNAVGTPILLSPAVIGAPEALPFAFTTALAGASGTLDMLCGELGAIAATLKESGDAHGEALASIMSSSSPLAQRSEEIAQHLRGMTCEALRRAAARFTDTAAEARAVTESRLPASMIEAAPVGNAAEKGPSTDSVPIDVEAVTALVKAMGLRAIKETAIATELGRYHPITIASIEAVADALHMRGFDVYKDIAGASGASPLARFRPCVVTEHHKRVYSETELWSVMDSVIVVVAGHEMAGDYLKKNAAEEQQVVEELRQYETIDVNVLKEIAAKLHLLPGTVYKRIRQARYRSPLWWRRVRFDLTCIESDPVWPSLKRDAEAAERAALKAEGERLWAYCGRPKNRDRATHARRKLSARVRDGSVVTVERMVEVLRDAKTLTEASIILSMSPARLSSCIRDAETDSPLAEFKGVFKRGRGRETMAIKEDS